MLLTVNDLAAISLNNGKYSISDPHSDDQRNERHQCRLGKKLEMGFFFSVPSTFLMPTSFALLALRAVDKLIKLMHAISRDKGNNPENIHILHVSIRIEFGETGILR